jgi:hypothetical protein
MTMIFILALLTCTVGLAINVSENNGLKKNISQVLLVLSGTLAVFFWLNAGAINKNSKHYTIKTEVRTKLVNNGVVSQDTVYIITRK